MRRTGHRAFRLVGEILAAAIALGIAALFLVGSLLSRQTADLTPLRSNFEQWFAQSFDGARAELGDLELRWNPSDDTVAFEVQDVIVYSEDGAVLQKLDHMKAITQRSALLTRRASLQDLEIVGGEASYVEHADGRIVAGLGSPETVGGFGPVFRGRTATDGQDNRMEWLDDVRSITLRNTKVHVRREKDRLDLTLAIDTLRGVRDGDVASLSFAGKIENGRKDDRAQIDVTILTQDRFGTTDVSVATLGLVPSRIAPEEGRYAVLTGADVPLDMRLDATLGEGAGLLSASMDLSLGEGIVTVAGQPQKVVAGRFVGSLDPGDQEMQVDTLSLQADRLSFDAEGVIRQIGRLSDGDIGTSPKFDLNVSDMRIDMTPLFAAPISVLKTGIVGEIDLDTRSLTLDGMDAALDGFSLELSGLLRAGPSGLDAVSLSGRSTSSLGAPQLLSIWPVEAADGARRWIERAVLDGSLQNVAFNVDRDRAFFEDPKLTQDRLDVSFDVQDGVVRYISTMDPLTEARGSGRIDGNRFGFVLDSGRINDIAIVGGDVDIPRLTPKGGDILITANATGGVSDLLSLINQPPFRYLDRYGASPDGFGGDANVTLNIRRPLLEYFDEDRIEYSVSGGFTNAFAPFSFGEYSISAADVIVRGGKDGLFLDGPANIGPWRANLSWAERYGQGGEPTRYRLSGTVDRATLDAFGIGLREFFGGELDVDVEASGRGLDVTDALVTVGLEQAELSAGASWSKAVGVPGRMLAEVKRRDGRIVLPRLEVEAPGLVVNGAAAFGQEAVLESARLDKLRVDGLVDGSLTLLRDEEMRRLSLVASGSSLDVSRFVSNALADRSGGAPSIPLAVDARFDRITLAPDYTLSEAALTYRHDGEIVESMAVTGGRPRGAFGLELGEAEAGMRQAVLSLPDLSAAANAFLGLDSTRGGSLRIEAKLPPKEAPVPILGQAMAENFMLRDAPFLAQILSLASLTGIVDTLSGEGLAFDEMSFDFALQNRVLSVRDAKLRGPAIGMTGAGEVDLSARDLDFGGTLVPAYTANSILGDVPLLGDLLVGRDGEGVFALTYAVDGPFSGALVAINPLSALTPGFIRGIFRENRDDLPDSMGDAADKALPESENPG
ncbi:MAG: AsmA-like C-terminal domain-containing protein [Pseudomonadota bacterium]